MTAILTFAIAAAAIAAGFWLQTKSDKTVGYAVAALLVTAVTWLITPAVLGVASIYLFGVAFAFAFGARIVFKEKMVGAARKALRA